MFEYIVDEVRGRGFNTRTIPGARRAVLGISTTIGRMAYSLSGFTLTPEQQRERRVMTAASDVLRHVGEIMEAGRLGRRTNWKFDARRVLESVEVESVKTEALAIIGEVYA